MSAVFITSDQDVYICDGKTCKEFAKIPDFKATNYFSYGNYPIIFITEDHDVYVMTDSGLTPSKSNIKGVWAHGGDGYFLVLSPEGKVYAWGVNEFGALGTSTIGDQFVELQTPPIARLICDYNATIFITKSDGIYFCGNEDNVFGMPFTLYPTKISNFTPDLMHQSA